MAGCHVAHDVHVADRVILVNSVALGGHCVLEDDVIVGGLSGVHQFGSATLDSSSPHYSDQALDFANEVLHDPLFDDKKRQYLIERRYRPGE